MTKDELNLEIAQARGWTPTERECDRYDCSPPERKPGERLPHKHTGWVSPQGHYRDGLPDFTSDTKWPILFRELPCPLLKKYGGALWLCDADIRGGSGYSIKSDLGEAVGEAWLKWKKQQPHE